MAQFTGLTDVQWQLLEGLIGVQSYARGKGHPPAHP